MPRPCEFSQEKADLICQRIAEGEALRTICRESGFPSASTVCRWLASHADFRRQYSAAREVQAEILLDEVLEIADACAGDASGAAITPTVVQGAKLRIDARKWLIAKLAPKRYGEKLDVDLSGAVKVAGKLRWRRP